MSDLISRQDAIDALELQAKEMSRWVERYTEQAKGVLTAKNVIEDLPSVQSETNCSEFPNNSDTISRQAAIEAIHEDADWLAAQGSDWQVERMERDKSILKSLPSAEPEPERGFWYPIQRGEQGYSAGDFRCSVCGQPNHCSHVTKYCCSCGAKMER